MPVPNEIVVWRSPVNRWDIIGYFLCLAAAIHLPTDADPDLWGHVRFGLDKIANRGIVWTDSYSYLTEGRAWINHEWLSEILFATAWKLGGSPGLIVLKMIVVALIHAVAYRFLLRAGFSAISGGLILLALSMPLGSGLRFVRPQLFTLLMFLIVCGWIADDEAGKRPIRWRISLLFVIWANLHGGVLAGLALLSGWTGLRLLGRLARVKSGASSEAGRIAAIAAGCWLACLINPYGWRLLEFLLRETTVPRGEIADWAPLDLSRWRDWSYPVLFGMGMWGLVRPARVSFTMLGLFAMTAIAPLLAVRHLPLFAIAVLTLTARPAAWLSIRFRHHCRSRSETARRLEQSLGWSVCGLMLLGLAAWREQGRILWDRPGDEPMPAAAIELLKQSDAHGGLAVHFNWGEYVIWHLGDAVQVSIDGRRETLYSPAAYQENLDWARGLNDWDRLLRRDQTRFALVSKSFPSFALMRLKPDWQRLYEDKTCALFGRTGAEDSARIKSRLKARGTVAKTERSGTFP